MTNFSGASAQQRFRREHILLGAPLISGLLVAGSLGWFLLRPALKEIAVLEGRVGELIAMQQQLPPLREKLSAAQLALGEAQAQQEVLVKLIAGSDRIQTFLALLDQVARATAVEIQRYEPVAVAATAPPPSRSRRQQAKTPSKPSDPLVALGYRKSAVALRVTGPYQALQNFLQEMESLEVLVESSDLNLSAAGGGADGEASSLRNTDLALRLSFYDRMPPAESGSAPASSNNSPR